MVTHIEQMGTVVEEVMTSKEALRYAYAQDVATMGKPLVDELETTIRYQWANVTWSINFLGSVERCEFLADQSDANEYWLVFRSE
jgi:hypothetical protein